MSRLPLAAFGALVVATVGAFFVTQHLKVSTPLIAGFPHPSPSYISPDGNGCGGANRVARFSFYLLNRADDVDVFIVDQSGNFIRTLATGRHMPKRVRVNFPWNGREDNGSVAPDGKYYYRIALVQQGRTVEYTHTPVTVLTEPPHPVVTSVTPSLIPSGTSPVTITYTGTERNGGFIQLYRTDLPGTPRVLSFATSGNGRRQWDGMISGHPAPAGTYLVGLRITDKACNTGYFPATIPPARGSTPNAGVTVRYLAAQPPLNPVPAGTTATVFVDSRQKPYHWALRSVDNKKVLEHGTVRGSSEGVSPTLSVHMPAGGPGLYELAIRSGPHRALVPLIASRRHGGGKVLVVLPALTWQGLNLVDDNHDGLPNTLTNGGPIDLQRPLANGLPAGFGDEAALIAYLDKSHLGYDLTTDLGLVDGTGPLLSGHRGVVLPGSEMWVPTQLKASLLQYAQTGGRVLSVGVDSLRRTAIVSGTTAVSPSSAAANDIFGAHVGGVVANNHDLILVFKDGLHIFTTTSTAFPGFHSFQTFPSVSAPGGQLASVAGTSTSTASIVGFPVGRGSVVEIGLQNFGTSLSRGNTDAQELVRRLWTVLSG